MAKKTFNPNDHITKLQNKEYLEVKWRLVWFRTDHPNGQVITDVKSIEPLIVHASIQDETGRILATGLGSADAGERKVVWSGREIEKAETAAIGRALAHAGYGTQFTGEVETALADSPVERKSPPARQAEPVLPAVDPPQPGEATTGNRPHQHTPTTGDRPFKTQEQVLAYMNAQLQKSVAPMNILDDRQVQRLGMAFNGVDTKTRHAFIAAWTGADTMKKLHLPEMEVLQNYIKEPTALQEIALFVPSPALETQPA